MLRKHVRQAANGLACISFLSTHAVTNGVLPLTLGCQWWDVRVDMVPAQGIHHLHLTNIPERQIDELSVCYPFQGL
jgi:hypothetical protein